MKKHLRTCKDFADIMATVNFEGIKPLKALNELTLDELQSYINFYQQHEIPFIYEALQNATTEKEVNFLNQKLQHAQIKIFEYSTQHIRLAFNLQ